MSNNLRQVNINGLDYEIMGRPRYYVLSLDYENRRHLVECSELYYNTHYQKFLISKRFFPCNPCQGNLRNEQLYLFF